MATAYAARAARRPPAVAEDGADAQALPRLQQRDRPRHSRPATCRPRVLHEYELPAFRAPIAAGAAVAVMASYNLVNGRPAHAQPAHQRRAARLDRRRGAAWSATPHAPTNLADRRRRYYADHAASHAAALRAGIDSFTDNDDRPERRPSTRLTEALRARAAHRGRHRRRGDRAGADHPVPARRVRPGRGQPVRGHHRRGHQLPRAPARWPGRRPARRSCCCKNEAACCRSTRPTAHGRGDRPARRHPLRGLVQRHAAVRGDRPRRSRRAASAPTGSLSPRASTGSRCAARPTGWPPWTPTRAGGAAVPTAASAAAVRRGRLGQRRARRCGPPPTAGYAHGRRGRAARQRPAAARTAGWCARRSGSTERARRHASRCATSPAAGYVDRRRGRPPRLAPTGPTTPPRFTVELRRRRGRPTPPPRPPRADVAVVVVGNHPLINGRETEDRVDLALPPAAGARCCGRCTRPTRAPCWSGRAATRTRSTGPTSTCRRSCGSSHGGQEFGPRAGRRAHRRRRPGRPAAPRPGTAARATCPTCSTTTSSPPTRPTCTSAAPRSTRSGTA